MSMLLTKEIKAKEEAREAMLRGVNKLSDAVTATLGPGGRNVIIERGFGLPPHVTKDGVTVAKNIAVKDHFENMGIDLVREVASKTNDVSGDGTTTATLLASSIFSEGSRRVGTGSNPVILKAGIDAAAKQLVRLIKDSAIPVSGTRDIERVGTISANGDSAIGGLIAKAMDAVGKNGVITVDASNALEDSLDVVKGMQIGNGFVSPYFANDDTHTKAVFEHAKILLFQDKISNLQDIVPILTVCMNNKFPLIIVAKDFDQEVLATLVLNHQQGRIHCCAVKAPGTYDQLRREFLEDIAATTGATLIHEDKGSKLSSATIDQLGEAEKVVCTFTSTTFFGGKGTKEAIDKRVLEIETLKKTALSDYEFTLDAQRIAKLTGGIAVVHVGGATETVIKEKKDRVDDVLGATKAAVNGGIVPGGGSALLGLVNAMETARIEIIKQSPELEGSEDWKSGWDIIIKSMKAPIAKILANAGISSEPIISSLSENYFSKGLTHFGYDVRSRKIVDMVETGIIDPAEVTINAITNAASVAGLMLTTDYMVGLSGTNEDLARLIAQTSAPVQNAAAGMAPLG